MTRPETQGVRQSACNESVGADHYGVLYGTRVGLQETGTPSGGIGGTEDQSVGGKMTLSMTWMTPFDAITSGVTTFALSFR